MLFWRTVYSELPSRSLSRSWRGGGGLRRKRRLGSENLREGGIRAHLVHIAATNTDRTNQLILHNDRQSASNKVIRQTRGLTKLQPNHASVNRIESLSNGT